MMSRKEKKRLFGDKIEEKKKQKKKLKLKLRKVKKIKRPKSTKKIINTAFLGSKKPTKSKKQRNTKYDFF